MVRERITFADPYKICASCGIWIIGVICCVNGPDELIPCGHRIGYRDVCPSWGPVDGCTCLDTLGVKTHGEP